MAPRGPSMCPRCGNLVGSEDDTCPECELKIGGASYQASAFWKHFLEKGSTTKVLLISFAVVFLVMAAVRGVNGLLMSMPGLTAYQFGEIVPVHYPWPGASQAWRLVTAMFLHGFLLHLLMNSFVLFQIGPLCETYFGARRTFVIFFLAGVGGFVWSWLGGDRPAVGASGGVLGICCAVIAKSRLSGGAIDRMIYSQLMGWMLFIVIIGFVVDFIDWRAHLGGMATGYVLGNLLIKEGGNRYRIHAALFWACIAVCIIGLGFGALHAITFDPGDG